MFLLNGKAIPLDVQFTVGEGDEAIQYPANWLRLSSPEERTAIGITELQQQPRADDRFYFVTDNGDGTSTALPKDLAMLKQNLIAQCKASARALLAETDWYIDRLSDPTDGRPMPQGIYDQRVSIKQWVELMEVQIADCEDVPALELIPTSWPGIAEPVA
nr:MAG TPA: hypothetical protein [Caudoviricetes sp.]